MPTLTIAIAAGDEETNRDECKSDSDELISDDESDEFSPHDSSSCSDDESSHDEYDTEPPPVAAASAKQDEKKQQRPKRPYTAYHIFYQLERELLLQELHVDVSSESFARQQRGRRPHRPPPAAPGGEEDVLTEPLPARYAGLTLPKRWYDVNARHKTKPKRKHRKSHGIGFLPLTRMISQRWKNNVDEETRQFCKDMSRKALEVHREAMKVWNTKQKQEKALDGDDDDDESPIAAASVAAGAKRDTREYDESESGELSSSKDDELSSHDDDECDEAPAVAVAAASAAAKKDKKQDKKKRRPKRPYTPYNIFFQLEREFILHELRVDQLSSTRARPVPGGMEDVFTDPLPARYAGLTLSSNWYDVNAKTKPRRKHRKTHGAITFLQLTKMISERWKNVDKQSKKFCKDMSRRALEVYKELMEVYNAKQQQQQQQQQEAEASEERRRRRWQEEADEEQAVINARRQRHQRESERVASAALAARKQQQEEDAIQTRTSRLEDARHRQRRQRAAKEPMTDDETDEPVFRHRKATTNQADGDAQQCPSNERPNRKRRAGDTWNQRLAELVEYRNRTGHADYPTTDGRRDRHKRSKKRNDPDCWNPALSRWVGNQRHHYKMWNDGRRGSSMTHEKVAKLESIGFHWTVKPPPMGGGGRARDTNRTAKKKARGAPQEKDLQRRQFRAAKDPIRQQQVPQQWWQAVEQHEAAHAQQQQQQQQQQHAAQTQQQRHHQWQFQHQVQAQQARTRAEHQRQTQQAAWEHRWQTQQAAWEQQHRVELLKKRKAEEDEVRQQKQRILSKIMSRLSQQRACLADAERATEKAQRTLDRAKVCAEKCRTLVEGTKSEMRQKARRLRDQSSHSRNVVPQVQVVQSTGETPAKNAAQPAYNTAEHRRRVQNLYRRFSVVPPTAEAADDNDDNDDGDGDGWEFPTDAADEDGDDRWVPPPHLPPMPQLTRTDVADDNGANSDRRDKKKKSAATTATQRRRRTVVDDDGQPQPKKKRRGPPKSTLLDPWNTRFLELCHFCAQHGHTDVPWNDPSPLGSWVRAQRIAYRDMLSVNDDDDEQNKNKPSSSSSILTVERMTRLGSIGFRLEMTPDETDQLEKEEEDGAEPQQMQVQEKEPSNGLSRTWLRRLEELRQYSAQHDGSTDVPSKCASHPSLGRWVSVQRVEYQKMQRGEKAARMSADRIAALDEIGFDWGKPKASWDEHLDELRAYKESHGHTNVPKKYKGEKMLGRWVNQQRRYYRLRNEGKSTYLTDDKIQALEDLGFQWKSGRVPTWEERFHQLWQFKQTMGHSNVPRWYGPNPRLGQWVASQRQLYKDAMTAGGSSSSNDKGDASPSTMMTKERIELLESLGFEWTAPPKRRMTRDTWTERLEELIEYTKRTGHADYPTNTKNNRNNPQLSNWVANQRKHYKFWMEGRPTFMTEERVATLESIGFNWNLK